MRQGAGIAPTMIDLFAGCGGVSAGFKSQGFRVLAAVEWDKVTAETYRLNHPEVILYVEDIRDISPERVCEDCKLGRGELTVLSICAPCQAFSRQNRYWRTDTRDLLVLEGIRFVKFLRPLFVFIENVPGLQKRSDILNRLIVDLEGLGYRVSAPAIVDAVDYGVPQFRKRFILLGTRLNIELKIPEPMYASPKEATGRAKKPWLTVREAFAGLEELQAGEASATDPLHKARRHSRLNLERLRHIPPNGGSRHSLPPRLQLACHKRDGNIGYHDVYGRLTFDRPANTLTTGCTNITKGRFAHPIADRAITPREAARLQTFPDTYQFYGSYDEISAQIGNAVPVKLAQVFACYFYELWKRWESLGRPTKQRFIDYYGESLGN